jgi:nucleoside phosphorylase
MIAKANSATDGGFYELILKNESRMRAKAFVYIVSSIDDFVHLIENVKPDFSFLLFIHKGGHASTPYVDGKEIVSDLKELPFGDKLHYAFTTRLGKDEGDVDAVHFFTEPKLDYSRFKMNHVSELIGEGVVSVEPNGHPTPGETSYDFAVLTALFEDEHKFFDDNMKTADVEEEKNLKVGTFLEAKNFPSDYRKPILLSWQQNMGMVDAAAFSSRLITKYGPKFLIMGGVCGGLKEDVNLYDVIIPSDIIDYISGKYHKGKFIPTPLNSHPSRNLIGHLVKHKDRIIRGMEDLASSSLKKVIRSGHFDIHFKKYACGPLVMKTDGVLPFFATHIDSEIVGLEMESLGVVKASELFSTFEQYSLVVKSVMDFTDGDKKDGDKRVIKHTASEISYLCIRSILPILQEFKDPKAIKKSAPGAV